MRPGLSLLLAVIGGSVALPLDAATTSTFQVSATVTAGCLVVGGVSTWGTLDFGSHSALSTGNVSTALGGTTVTLQCTPGVSLSMRLNGGQNSAAGLRNLKRGSGTALVAYQLFADAGLSQVLGIDQNVAVAYGDATAIKLPVYARAQLTGNLPAGSYTDVVQVVVSF
ncbi:spore coat U domain-containing protein [Pseudomonas sp. BJa5]|uniref:Csu type fimbrial protein n=1 Tax=Pseudomonas sp. BJa5 TaxID=2936270 RepID=UPI002559F257|nr:spore coat U domain-containing protein [Pseudomonas sp. BGr12]MDL2419931.1 spore coat U domain-containing protein [Pseudomonas sp. BGr12]